MERRLHNAQLISWRSQLCNAHKDVDLGRVAAHKNDRCNPNHFTISYFKNPKPFSLLVSILCNWLLYLYSCCDHLITLFIFYLNRLTMGAKVDFVYIVLNFVRNCNIVKIGGPTSISQQDFQQFHGCNWTKTLLWLGHEYYSLCAFKLMAFHNPGLNYWRYCVYNSYFGRHDDEIRCRKWIATVDGATHLLDMFLWA